LRVLDQNTATRSLAVAKLGALTDINHERERYQKYVSPCLGVGAFTPLMDEVRAGAGAYGGIFYTLAVGYEESLFDVLVKDPALAGRIVTQGVKPLLKPWYDGARPRFLTVGDVRTQMLKDSDVLENSPVLRGIRWDRFEQQKLHIRECCQHRDLHGLNILVAANRPVVIDYGEVDIAAASLDPITLELSLVFHPRGKEIRGSWPTVTQGEKWHDLDQYVDGSPFAEFVRACREWACEAGIGNRELYANTYAYCARQLKYPDTDHSLAATIMKGVMDAFERT
jgi:hypothetical protein